jgi:hypothetical protein
MDEVIDGVVITRVQVDGGSNANLKNAKTMEKLGLTQLQPTIFILKMVEQNRVEPMGVLFVVCIIIVRIEYHIDYIVFKLLTSTFSYLIWSRRPSLYQAKARNDWGKGTLTLGQHKGKVVLQMHPMQYHGGTQEEELEFTYDVESVTFCQVLQAKCNTFNNANIG